VLIAVYAVFAVAATGRSVYQLATRAGEAPFPYALSALAAVVYIAATLGLARQGETLSVADAELFPDDTVWSSFGAGYGFLPLVLPFAGLAWLWRTRAPH
jgi:hypothetical protein